MENEFETAETQEQPDVSRGEPAARPAWRLPLVLTLISLLVWFGFQTVALVFERNQLIAVKGNFDAGVQEAQKTQAQLETLITRTAELASKGHASAKAAIEELAKRGIPLQSVAPPAK
jgi:hypothetical protein